MQDYAYYSANSGLTPLTKFALDDHYLAWLRSKTGRTTGTIGDLESLLYGGTGGERGYYLTQLALPDTGQSLSALKGLFYAGGSGNPNFPVTPNPVDPGSSTAAPVYISDTFTQTDGTAWNPALWTFTAATGASNSILSNRGRLASPSATYNTASRMTSVANQKNVDLKLTFRFVNLTDSFSFINVRDNGTTFSGGGDDSMPQTGYSFRFFSASTGWQFKENSTGTLLTSGTTAWATGTDYFLRIQTYNTLVRFKVWTGTEPTAWNYEGNPDGANDQIAGPVVIRITSGGAQQTMDFDDIQVNGYVLNSLPSAIPGTSLVNEGTTWTRDFAQDFGVAAPVGTVRTAYTSMGYFDGFTDTSKKGLYKPDNVLAVHDSMLDFYLHAEAGQPLVATVMPDNYTARTYGRYSLRYKSTHSGDGYKFVPMFWPTSDNWNQGEIDWPEARLGSPPSPASAVAGSGIDANGGSSTSTGLPPVSMSFRPNVREYAPTDDSGWHVATVEWMPGKVRFYWDNLLIAVVTEGVPTVPMRIELQAETWTDGGVVPTSSVGHIYVDWVVAYH